MPTVRLSGTILSENDPGRVSRAKLLHLLFNGGWNIYNSNGDQRITLSNIEKKIIESDSFVFTPNPSLEDMFKAISIFVGYQTLDRNLAGKPTVILNADGSWNNFFSVISHLNRMGTIKQDYREFLLSADTPEAVLECLEQARSNGLPDAGREKMEEATMPPVLDVPPPSSNMGNVCVFCSASLEDPSFVRDGETLGKLLALNQLGCVSGAGKSGIMGAVVRGTVMAGGWAAGSNVPHIIELEGLPEGLSQFWLRPDIYTRMEVMIENSDAFVIFPGGAGTFQELLALMIFKFQKNPLMEGKPVVIFNRRNPSGVGFWDPLIDLLDGLCPPGYFVVASTLDDVIPYVSRAMA